MKDRNILTGQEIHCQYETLAMKAETDDIHAIFLLKKNVQTDIIKTILGYSPITALETLKEWKVVITSVGQGYESMESWHDYKTGTGTIFKGRRTPMNIRKSRDNFDKDGRPRCFNCNTYGHMAKECWKPKKDKETRRCYKCDKVGHLAKDCRLEQKIKNRSVQEKSDEEDDNKQKGFVEGSE